MFRLAKYYMLLNLYKRAKKNIIRVFLSVFVMVFISYLFADIIAIAGEEYSYTLLALKWILLLVPTFIIVINIRKLVKIVSSPFGKEVNEPMIDVKKEIILAKEHLMTKSERIIEKYRSA